MTKEEILKQINELINKIDDEVVLADILSIVEDIHQHFISGNWER